MSGSGNPAVRLVAHRGYPAAFPENTLLGYQQSAAHGARYVETDVQCTRDGVPVLYHDVSTERMSAARHCIYDLGFDELSGLSAFDPERFGRRFEGVPIPSLRAFAGWLANLPDITAFVEIKEESIGRFGVDTVLKHVLADLAGVERRCAIISFEDRCVALAAERGMRTGWVLPGWNSTVEARARELAPDYLFADVALLPGGAGDIWRGPWQWAAYVVNEPAGAAGLAERGVELVETDVIGEMNPP